MCGCPNLIIHQPPLRWLFVDRAGPAAHGPGFLLCMPEQPNTGQLCALGLREVMSGPSVAGRCKKTPQPEGVRAIQNSYRRNAGRSSGDDSQKHSRRAAWRQCNVQTTLNDGSSGRIMVRPCQRANHIHSGLNRRHRKKAPTKERRWVSDGTTIMIK